MSNLPERLQEEKILRTLRARRRLRAMIKNVMHNMYWLIDDYDKVEEVVDEKEAIKRLVTRQTRQSKPGALTIKEKAILRKHPDWRTDAEKHIINKYLGGLRCFRRYPEDVQYKLVAVSYFEYFGPNRVLVRQNHEAQAMYFILSGEVAITREVFDEFENKWVTQELGKNGVGSMFGEVSLLHGMKRSATATTLSNLDNQKEPSIQSADSDDSLRSTQNHNKEIRPSSLEASTKSPYPTITEIRKIGLAERTSILPAYQRKTRSIPCEGFPEHVKIRFMQVCTLSEKSTFSNNNMLDNRRVIALTPVKCILIPTYWLTQHNKGNVWTRVMNYINWRMPTHEQVFRKYVAHKKWIDFKKKLVSDVLHNKKYVNHTTIHDVPYSIRVMHEEN